MIYNYTDLQVNACVRDCVPHIADHIINKACANEGMSDNPQAVHPVTKLLTINLDNATRFAIESELIEHSKVNEHVSIGQIKFIKACFSTINYNLVIESVGSAMSQQIWEALNDDCCRDGCLFLKMMNEWDGDLKTAADRFVSTWSV